MERISLENWAPSPEDPTHMHYAGPRTAQEVFQELYQRLEGMGYLPDEYFDMDDGWLNGRMIPKDADVFCTTDYGGSEGIYVDVYLKWFEEGKPITKCFALGKTLGETGTDLDRMFLISSAITKAFHGDHGTYARYIRTGEDPTQEDAIIHLSGTERRILLDTLVEHRIQLVEEAAGMEQVIRRIAGTISEYINEVGQRPMRLSDYDKTVLSIQDGALEVFKETYPKAREQAVELLTQAAARPGTVGRQMCALILADATGLSYERYLGACKKAVGTGDLDRVRLFIEQAEHCVKDLAPSLYGELITHAYAEDQRHISDALIRQATPGQIAAAPSVTLYLPAVNGDFPTAQALVEKGIDASGHATQILHTVYASHNGWMAEYLLENGMRVDVKNLSALQACITNDGLKGAQLLLDRGMDLERYLCWTKENRLSTAGHEGVLKALEDHWEHRSDTSGQSPSEPGGLTLG